MLVWLQPGFGRAVAQAGTQQYTDRSYTITDVSAQLDGACLIQTPNNDKGNAQAEYLTLEMTDGAEAWLAFDDRYLGPLPTWLRTTVEPGVIKTTDATLVAYPIIWTSNNVIIPGNSTFCPPAQSCSNFIVVLTWN